MKQQLLLVTLLITLSIQLSAQLSVDKLDLSTYSPAEQRYRTLYFNAISDYSANVQTFRNTKQSQVETRFSGGLDQVGGAGLSYFGEFELSIRNYLYKPIPKLFGLAEVGLATSFNGNYFQSQSGTLTLGLGYGRINIVNEVELAERILEKVHKDQSGSLADYQAVVLDLANIFTELKNKRWITNRGEWESDLSAILSFLQSRGYDSLDEDLVKELTKLYRTEPLITRRSGSTISLTSTVRGNFNNYLAQFERNLNVSQANVKFEKYVYLNSKLQWDTKGSVEYGKATEQLLFESLPNTWTFVGLDLSSSLHYLPNKDSRFSTTLSAFYRTDFLDLRFPSATFKDFYELKLGIEYEHRVGRNLRMSIGAELKYNPIDKFVAPLTLGLKF